MFRNTHIVLVQILSYFNYAAINSGSSHLSLVKENISKTKVDLYQLYNHLLPPNFYPPPFPIFKTRSNRIRINSVLSTCLGTRPTESA